jgi:hypothetical protein
MPPTRHSTGLDSGRDILTPTLYRGGCAFEKEIWEGAKKGGLRSSFRGQIPMRSGTKHDGLVRVARASEKQRR